MHNEINIRISASNWDFLGMNSLSKLRLLQSKTLHYVPPSDRCIRMRIMVKDKERRRTTTEIEKKGFEKTILIYKKSR